VFTINLNVRERLKHGQISCVFDSKTHFTTTPLPVTVQHNYNWQAPHQKNRHIELSVLLVKLLLNYCFAYCGEL
jgi:hypothetical protein